MGRVHVYCPRIKEAIVLRTPMSRTAYEAGLKRRNPFVCPACGELHSWDADNSRLVEEPQR